MVDLWNPIAGVWRRSSPQGGGLDRLSRVGQLSLQRSNGKGDRHGESKGD